MFNNITSTVSRTFSATCIFLCLLFAGKSYSASITTTPTLYGPYCNNVANTISIIFTYTGTFSDSFKVQISNPYGVFPTDYVTGIIGSDTASPITAIIPSGIAAGTAYRIRVINHYPTPTFGSNNGSNITITGIPVLPAITGFSKLPVGGTTNLADGASGGTWSSSDTLVATVGSTGIVKGVNTGSDTIIYTYTNSCGLTNSVSKAVSVVNIPVITSVSPSVAIPGSSVTISGNNFNTSTADNTLYFGATKGTITSLSATSITATVPVGATYSSITLSDSTTGLIADWQQPFIPTYNNTGLTPDTFHLNAASILAAAGSPIGDALGDLDGDGRPDLVVVNSGPNNIYIYRNLDSGTALTATSFASPIILSTSYGPHYVKIADLDGDGRLDIVVTNTSTSANKISVFRNISTPGTLTFAARVDFSTGGSSPFDLSIADFDMDGKPDIAVVNQSSNKVDVLRNQTAPGVISASLFATAVSFSTGSIPFKLFTGDLDGDGKPDIAVTNYSSNTISILHNTATTGTISITSFAAATSITTGTAPTGIAGGDIDGDGKTDLLVTNSGSNTLSVFRNTNTSTGTPSFAAAVNFTTGTLPEDLVSGDIDGDGKPDVALANYTANTLSIFRNTASSGTITSTSLAAKVDFATGDYPAGLVLGDIDGDKKPDLAVVNGGAGTVSIFKNNPLPPNGPISGIDSICLGTTTTLTAAVTGGTWRSANTSIATVNASGIVTSVSGGLDTIAYFTVAQGDTNFVYFPLTVNVFTRAARITTTSRTLCLSAVLPLTDSVDGGTWTSSNAAVATINSAGFATGRALGNDIITYTVTNSCGTSADTLNITVNPATGYVIGAVSGVSAICAGSSAVFTDTTAGGQWMSTDTSIAAVNATGTVTGVSFGTTTISYGFNGSCGTYFATANINIDTTLNADSISGPTAVCVASAITLSDLAGAGGTWSVANGLASVSATGMVTGMGVGIDTVHYTISNSCGSSIGTKIVNVRGLPNAGNITGVSTVCANDTITLSDTITGGAWAVTNSHAASLGSGKIKGLTIGIDTVRYIVGNSCGSDTATASVTILGTPAVGAINGPSVVCLGGIIVLSDTTAGGVWGTKNSNATVSDSLITGVAAGTDTIYYRATNACGTTVAIKSITISTHPPADTISGPSVVCTGNTIALSDSTTGGTWSKTNSNASVSSSGVVSGVTPGVDTIIYSVSGTCSALEIAIKVITVVQAPSAGTITGPSALCVGDSITLQDTVSGGNWSVSNSFALIADTILRGVTVGIDTLKYTISAGCGLVSTTKKITVSPQPTAAAVTGSSALYVGEIVVLKDSVKGGVWSLANENAIITPSGELGALVQGHDTAIYTVTNSCGVATARFPVTIYSSINPDAISAVDIYPNPGKGVFTLNLSSNMNQNVSVVISTAVYKVMSLITVPTNTPTLLDLSSEPDGVYFLSAITPQGFNTVKFVIVR